LMLAVFFLSAGLSWDHVYQKDLTAHAAAFPEIQKGGVLIADLKVAAAKENSEFEQKVQTKIDEYKEKMSELEAKAKDLEGKAKDEAKEEMDEMRAKLDEVNEKLKSMKSATGQAWEKMKSEVNSAMESAENTYKKLAARFK
jgi:uncharacterized coiled-coil DUF342 family protein